jgi:kynurenine 3-monooxygenase
VVVFDEILEKYVPSQPSQREGVNWEMIFKEYETLRKKDTDAIADLAVDNFHEMKEHTAMEIFQRKRKLETAFESEFPVEYYSKYSLVTFKESISYSEAMKLGRAQDKAILNLLKEGKLAEDLSLKEKLELVKKETEAILQVDEVSFG